MITLGQMLKAVMPIPLQQRLLKSLATPQQRDLLSFTHSMTFFEDGLATKHNADFMKDARFLRAYELGKQTGSWRHYVIHWRAYVACWAASMGALHEGDFVECGVYRGGFSRMIIDYINFSSLNKQFYLLDTYEGLEDSLILESERKRGIKAGTYESSYEDVVATFASFPMVKVIKGIVPDTLSQVASNKIAYLSIDMNNRTPEIATATFFWDLLVSGAVILLDDYGFTNYIDQKMGFDEFAKERNVPILSMPTGQGIIIKP